MLILGIDPGIGRLGWAVVERSGSKLTDRAHGLIETPAIPVPDRLRLIHEQFTTLLELHKPDAVATERQLFAANKTTALDVAKALGVVLLCTSQHGLPWSEYTPPEIKQAVVGNGSADKKQVQFMVTKLLSLAVVPKPDDVADALAIAICHALRTRVKIG